MGLIKKKTSGFALIELVIAVAIFMIFVGSLAVSALGSHLTRLENADFARVSTRIVESWEALRIVRADGWSNLINGSHGLILSGASWQFSGISDTDDGITRVVTVSDVYRDGGGNIAPGGTLDPDTKKIQIQLSWNTTPDIQRTVDVQSYLTNYAPF